jgi:uncharacterized protein YndB with AHSA1/START domain
MDMTVPGSGTNIAMAQNEIVIDAPPERVYETLIDASCYPKWIIGAKGLRGVDGSWPRRGARFHHRVGVGPLEIQDNTKLVATEPNRSVVLSVRARPRLTAIVRLALITRARGQKTKVVLTEEVDGGALSWFRNPLLTGTILVRNALSLRRLRRLVASSCD